MLYISFSQEKYRVGISLLYSVLILLNSENPLRFLRIAVDMRILFSCSYYLLIASPAFSWYPPPVNCVLWQYSQLGQSSFHQTPAGPGPSQDWLRWCGFNLSSPSASISHHSPAAVLRCSDRPPNHQLPSLTRLLLCLESIVRLSGSEYQGIRYQVAEEEGPV